MHSTHPWTPSHGETSVNWLVHFAVSILLRLNINIHWVRICQTSFLGIKDLMTAALHTTSIIYIPCVIIWRWPYLHNYVVLLCIVNKIIINMWSSHTSGISHRHGNMHLLYNLLLRVPKNLSRLVTCTYKGHAIAVLCKYLVCLS